MKVENTDVTSRRLKETRETRRMTLQELSDLTGFSTSVLSRYENGHIEKLSCERLSIIAKALNVSPVWLMGFDESNSEPSENEYMLDTVEREIIETYRKADGRQKMRIGAVVTEIADEIEKNAPSTNGNGKVGWSEAHGLVEENEKTAYRVDGSEMAYMDDIREAIEKVLDENEQYLIKLSENLDAEHRKVFFYAVRTGVRISILGMIDILTSLRHDGQVDLRPNLKVVPNQEQSTGLGE